MSGVIKKKIVIDEAINKKIKMEKENKKKSKFSFFQFS